MDILNLHEENVDYQPAQRIYWTGRKSNPDIGKQYWHQEIELCDINHVLDPIYCLLYTSPSPRD